MKILGIELDSNRLCYVLASGSSPEDVTVIGSGKLQIGETREANDIRKFADEVADLVKSLAPDRIAVKAKPESGQMRAGAAALKMEAILIAQTACDVYFLSPQRLKPIEDKAELFAYLQGAWKAAVGGFDPPKKKPAAKGKPKTK
ncbi:DUF3010 family protein [Pararhizobium sp. BT-229]|uniref:DUF3010 family protein n=1 Tax=Pararhizobium sp. BT-229 TaxID=2986923 RepID=UPI0021F7EBF9|nr:DUF3010 family protein [Pararhizobium sp. BT-229]MCV9964141.1 DUF3010 family protein [Pararhizobium sp. BT-229]